MMDRGRGAVSHSGIRGSSHVALIHVFGPHVSLDPTSTVPSV